MTTTANSTAAKTRIRYFDMAKGVGILFVVVYHILGSLMQTDYKAFMPLVTRYIVTIALPIFFIISGMQDHLGNIRNKDFKIYASKKLKVLLVPFFTFSVISILINQIQSLVLGQGIDKAYLRGAFISIVTFKGFSVYWFLPALLIGQMVFFFSLGLSDGARRILYIGLVFLILLSFNHFEAVGVVGAILITIIRGLYASCYICFGYELFSIFNILDKAKIKRTIYFLVGVLGLVGQGFLSARVGDGDINSMCFDHPFLFLLSALIGSVSIILLLRLLEDKAIISASLSSLGTNSLIIMGTHMDYLVLSLAFYLGYLAARLSPKAKELVLYICIVAVVFAVEALLIWLYNNCLYWMIGKTKKH